MIYAGYPYYAEVYSYASDPLLKHDEYMSCAAKASAYIDYYTLGRAAALVNGRVIPALGESFDICERSRIAAAAPEMPDIMDACCALAEQYYIISCCERAAKLSALRAVDAAGEGEARSESVGSYSVTRQTGAEAAAAARAQAEEARRGLPSIARRYLAHTGLLYRGV